MPQADTPTSTGESPMDYFSEAVDFGLQAGLSEDEARSAAFDMARGRDPGYWGSYGLDPAGEDPSMAQQMAHRKRVRQGAARARTGRMTREEQAQAEYIAQLVEPYSHMANQRAEAKRRQEEELMGLAQRLQDTGTLHAPGPSAGRYTAGYQPLPQLPSPVDMGRDPMRLPAMDLSEYRRQVMMEMLLNQSGRPVAYDPALLDTLGQ